MSEALRVPKLGVGLAYGPSFRGFVERGGHHFDFLEVVPDTLWTDAGAGRSPRHANHPSAVEFIEGVRGELTVVPHSIGLSVGSAHRFDREHVEQMARWHRWLDFPWHSDHLSFNLAEHAAGELNVGITLPLAWDRETLELLVPRISEVRARVPKPFLLENNVYFFSLPRQDFAEAEFLNRLCAESGCGLLLDLHNLYTNCRNHGTDPHAFLGELDLSNVLEMHVAGGLEHEGFYLDAHSDISPPEVWELLDRVLPRCPNVGGVVFELMDSWYEVVGEEKLAAQLARMRELWAKHQPAPARREAA
ncbi:MAG TPA: DUF692 family protein [Pyrinomonadaceae bacterium]|nr:DUF692 family protein [Pyrinomonadaceae bacterium]